MCVGRDGGSRARVLESDAADTSKTPVCVFSSRCFRFHDGPRPSFEPERKAKRHARVDEPRKMEKMDDGNDGEKIDRGSGVPVISDSDSVRTVTWKWGP